MVDQDPASRLPPYEAARCRYAAEWTAIKLRWQLTVDTAEREGRPTAAVSHPASKSVGGAIMQGAAYRLLSDRSMSVVGDKIVSDSLWRAWFVAGQDGSMVSPCGGRHSLAQGMSSVRGKGDPQRDQPVTFV